MSVDDPYHFDNVPTLIAPALGPKQKPAILTIEAPQPSFKLARTPDSRIALHFCT